MIVSEKLIAEREVESASLLFQLLKDKTVTRLDDVEAWSLFQKDMGKPSGGMIAGFHMPVEESKIVDNLNVVLTDYFKTLVDDTVTGQQIAKTFEAQLMPRLKSQKRVSMSSSLVGFPGGCAVYIMVGSDPRIPETYYTEVIFALGGSMSELELLIHGKKSTTKTLH